MKKIYDPKNIEQPLYEQWERQGYFRPKGKSQRDSYCIMMPPPNITGNLHMGHAFQQTIMDILIRYQRMQGKNTLWQVGTDHAGIAAQMIMEQKIAAEEGKTRDDYGRDAFIDKMWKWKTQSGDKIKNQMRRLGHSVDWERERFTMDNGFSNAVKEAFVCLYQKNLIYRGKRLVNWDPKLCTAISDLEIENRESKGFMWYLRYPLADSVRTSCGLNYLVVATTRPESIFGDTGVAVNPRDPFYRNLIGRFVFLPLIDRRIPIIGDEDVDMNKGTGCVKITPAHDFNDYKIGKRHRLPMINILTLDGNIRQEAEIFDTNGNNISNTFSAKIPEIFHGLERFSARKVIVAMLNRLCFLVETKTHYFTVPYSDRSGVIIEPMLTNQWHVRVMPLAKIAIEAVEQEKIQFVPKQYKNMYFSWMHNIQDWCISRQLWWGHRIPAWYDDTGQVYVGRSEVEVRQQNHLADNIALRQDDDVLDTWFSSGLWTFSALGWPNKTESLCVFHPTDVIVSGFDIIFFWIARMIMLTMYFIKESNGSPQIPFKTVYITGLICDEEGKKMSKSKGNVIDPLDMVNGISLTKLLEKRTSNMMQSKLKEKIYERTKKQFPNGIEAYGTDALRFTLTSLAATGRNINWDMHRLKGYRNFCNKLWNASRFVLKNTENQDCGFQDRNNGKKLSLADRWILAKFNQTVKIFRESLDNYRFDLAANILYEFTWHQFCDWYLEMVKSMIVSNNDELELRGTRYVLVTVLEALLRLAHPVIPFITEIIWQQVKNLTGNQGKTIMLQPFPIYDVKYEDIDAIRDVTWIKQVIVAIRTIRIEMNIASGKLLNVLLRHASPKATRLINDNLISILALARLNSITLLPESDGGPISFVQSLDDVELLIPMAGIIDKNIELERLSKEIARLENDINHISTKLNDNQFIKQAPKIVDKMQQKLNGYQQSKEKLVEKRKIVENL